MQTPLSEIVEAIGRLPWCAASLVALVIVIGIDKHYDYERQQKSMKAYENVLMQCINHTSAQPQSTKP